MLQLPMPSKEDRLSVTLPRTVRVVLSVPLASQQHCWTPCFSLHIHVYRLQLITHHQPLVRVACSLLSSQQHCLTPGFSLHTDSCLQIDYISPITNLLSEEHAANTTRCTAREGSPHNVLHSSSFKFIKSYQKWKALKCWCLGGPQHASHYISTQLQLRTHVSASHSCTNNCCCYTDNCCYTDKFLPLLHR